MKTLAALMSVLAVVFMVGCTCQAPAEQPPMNYKGEVAR